MHILESTGDFMTEVIGWFSSVILVLTIGQQVHKQWRSGSSEGISKWLFVGQITASTGFTLYSLLVRNWVFVVTNALLLVSAILGGIIVVKHRRAARRGMRPSVPSVPREPRTPGPRRGSPGCTGAGARERAPGAASTGRGRGCSAG